MMNPGLQMYQQVKVQSGVAAASPHRLVQMLLEGAVERIIKAKIAMANGEIAEKGNQIGGALAIVDSLRSSLDKEKGGEISQNLEALYEYMSRQLVSANKRNDPLLLDEVAGLLRQVTGAWEGIGEQVEHVTTGAPDVRISVGV